MVVEAIGAPLGRAISTWWVSRWVSTPTTASRSSASMGTGLVPSFGERDERSEPAWVEVTEWHIKGTPKRPDLPRVTPGHRHRAWWFSIQEHRNDTHRSSGRR